MPSRILLTNSLRWRVVPWLLASALLFTLAPMSARARYALHRPSLSSLSDDTAVSVRLSVAPPWRVTIDGEARVNGEPLPEGDYEITTPGTVSLHGGDMTRECGNGFLITCDTPIAVNGRHYRGTLLFRRYSILNTLHLQDYLRGVVGSEIGANVDVEALKAQTVVARTYTLAHLRPEIPDGTSFQVYRGMASESDTVNQAVDETDGQVLTYEGSLAREVCYHSTCGGHTEANENVFMTRPIPYLRAVACTLPAGAPQTLRLGDAAPSTPDAAAPSLVEQEESRRQEVAAVLPQGTALNDGSTAQRLDVEDLEGLGDETPDHGLSPDPATPPSALHLTLPATREAEPRAACESSNWYHWTVRWPAATTPEVTILKTSPSGRVVEVRVGGRLVYGDDIRRALCFRDVEGRAHSLNSTAFTLRREGDVIVVDGHGWGHGVGLCQWGARAMASAGVKYADILAHYFPGTQISSLR